MKYIGIQGHTLKPQALTVAKEAYREVERQGACPVFEEETARALGLSPREVPVSSCIVIGGDGTILRGAVRAATQGIPMIGVNLGRLGFLSEVEPSELPHAIARLLAGDYMVEERMMLRGSVNGSAQHEWIALNDFLVFKECVSRVTEVELRINGQVAGTYPCDGIIVSTPTGSTAYSLSAGGPVIAPTARGILVTPISPHKMSARPIFAAENDVIEIRTDGPNGLCSVSSDGTQHYENFRQGDVLTITRANVTTKLIHFEGYNFFKLVREKLF